MVENGFVYAIDKSIEKREKRQIREQKRSDKFYAICRKYDKALDELKRDDLLKGEFNFIANYIIKDLKYPLKFYPNLFTKSEMMVNKITQ